MERNVIDLPAACLPQAAELCRARGLNPTTTTLGELVDVLLLESLGGEASELLDLLEKLPGGRIDKLPLEKTIPWEIRWRAAEICREIEREARIKVGAVWEAAEEAVKKYEEV